MQIQSTSNNRAPGFFDIYNQISESKAISSTSKVVALKILMLSQKEGYCWATDKFLALQCGLSLRTQERSMGELRKNSFIDTETFKDEGGLPRRRIFISPRLRDGYAPRRKDVSRGAKIVPIDPKAQVESEALPPPPVPAAVTIESHPREQPSKVVVATDKPSPPPLAPYPYKEEKKKEEYPSLSPQPPTAAQELREFFFEALRREVPDAMPPSSKQALEWAKVFEEMLTFASRDRLKNVIAWTLHDAFWKTRACEPSAFRRHWNTICSAMTRDAASPKGAVVCEKRAKMMRMLKQCEQHDHRYGISVSPDMTRVSFQSVGASVGGSVYYREYSLSQPEFEERIFYECARLNIVLNC